MKTITVMTLLVLTTTAVTGVTLAAKADCQIRVTSVGEIEVKPDLCVILLQVKSTIPLVSDAVRQNDRKVSDVTAKLRELGVKNEDIEFYGNQFAPAGGRYYGPGQAPTGFDVSNMLKISIKNPDHSTEELGKKVALIVDELGKLGATAPSADILRYSPGGAAVIFTAQNPYEKQAYEQAIEKARPIAEIIAKKMGVKITGVHSVHATAPQLRGRPPFAGSSGLDFVHFSSSPEELVVKANVIVNFSFE